MACCPFLGLSYSLPALPIQFLYPDPASLRSPVSSADSPRSVGFGSLVAADEAGLDEHAGRRRRDACLRVIMGSLEGPATAATTVMVLV